MSAQSPSFLPSFFPPLIHSLRCQQTAEDDVASWFLFGVLQQSQILFYGTTLRHLICSPGGEEAVDLGATVVVGGGLRIVIVVMQAMMMWSSR